MQESHTSFGQNILIRVSQKLLVDIAEQRGISRSVFLEILDCVQVYKVFQSQNDRSRFRCGSKLTKKPRDDLRKVVRKFLLELGNLGFQSLRLAPALVDIRLGDVENTELDCGTEYF